MTTTQHTDRILKAYRATASQLDEGHVRLDFTTKRPPLIMTNAEWEAFLANEEATRMF